MFDMTFCRPTTLSTARPPALPATGFVRLPQILDLIPISRSAWWAGILDGRFPKGIKLGRKTTVWRAEDIRALIEQAG